jgi:8-oxo-dGTP diphosphatase
MNKVTVADADVDLKRGVDYIGVTINFLVHDGKGNVLLQKRSRNCRDEQGRWDIGGGALEFGERLADAVKREVNEELCTEPLRIEFLIPYEVHRENNGIPTHWMAFAHTVQVDPEQVKIGEPNKIDEIGWFTSKNLPSPRHSQFDIPFNAAIAAGIVT